MDTGECIHWNGLGIGDEKCCDAGVNYVEQFGSDPGIFLRLPCVRYFTVPAHGRGTYVKPGEPTIQKEHDRHGQAMIPCDKFIAATQEQVDADRLETEHHMDKMRLVIGTVSKWRTWTKKNRVAKEEVIKCPSCGGKLHLSQAAYNGHVWGQCETKDCVSWME
jgi:hypothetical protein